MAATFCSAIFFVADLACILGLLGLPVGVGLGLGLGLGLARLREG